MAIGRFGHGQDLVKYVQKHLGGDKDKVHEEVVAQILEKANGVFMWVVLVVGILNKELLNNRVWVLEERLKEIPSRLGNLFRDILRRDVTNIDDLQLCLQWILFAKRPLRSEEFYFAMVSGLHVNPWTLSEWNAEKVTTNRMSQFVLTSSKGLAELTKSKMPTVQSIHESVPDFLIKDGGMYELWQELKSDVRSSSHDRLKHCCQSYLDINSSSCRPFDATLPMASSNAAKDHRRTLAFKFPFLDYASQYVLYHADEAARTISQHDFLRNLALRPLLDVRNLFERYEVRRHTTDASLPYELAENNFARLIKPLHLDGLAWNVRGERYQFPLFAALANGHRDAIRALLRQNEDSFAEDIMVNLKSGKGLSFRKDHTPLLWALENEQKSLAECLIISTDVGLNNADRKGQTVISLAAKRGYERVVDLLTTRAVDANSKDKANRIPLSHAAEQGQESVAQLLLDGGADIEAADNDGRTALAWAAHNADVVTAEMNSPPSQYQMELMLLEEQNRKRLLMARVEQDRMSRGNNHAARKLAT
ncbi:hypothetical protein LTR49_025152 [Elasticomyces elasticus]|nr:hypothetical protein LTR49_025152 [Elasticomyces elasticus]